MIELDKLNGKAIVVESRDDYVLQIMEQGNYRWLQSGDAIQSLMDITKPAEIILPVYQAMLIFVLWLNKPVKLLNLGMGMGIFERALFAPENVGLIQQLTSVEQDELLISFAKTFFLLPEQTHIKQQLAQESVKDSNVDYDVILCDIFVQAEVASCLYDLSFFQHCVKTLNKNGVMMVNVMVGNESALIKMLTIAHQVFPFSALIAFADYKNVVLVLSMQSLPNLAQLLAVNEIQTNHLSIDFSAYLQQWHHLKQ